VAGDIYVEIVCKAVHPFLACMQFLKAGSTGVVWLSPQRNGQWERRVSPNLVASGRGLVFLAGPSSGSSISNSNRPDFEAVLSGALGPPSLNGRLYVALPGIPRHILWGWESLFMSCARVNVLVPRQFQRAVIMAETRGTLTSGRENAWQLVC